ncbi:uncharacterized protein LOC104893872 [Beta vulgaris subsp. vulgaris]|uniref:uncharacterized protein LOC104893872 n=1 Tax=Beta vulgaris subsp. vulgaris TaxID=3555 RepID=UPI00053FFE1F|nr:uncharacterized protein LOC104893872 [Beta vulgaris subsp. vulgaris]
MSNLAKLEFVALDITGKNYLSWILDAEIHLAAKGLGNTINAGNNESDQDKAKAMIFLRHHLHEALKNEYLTVKDPEVLWSNLKERYDHQKTVILPSARYEWLNLRLQDYKSISDYNSAMFRITSKLKLRGEKITDDEMLEKTYTTFHKDNLLLSKQYREKGFQKYSELISCLLVAEQNDELLLKNHELRPTGSAPFPEANAASHDGKIIHNKDHASSRGQGRGRGRGRGRGYKRTRGRGGYGPSGGRGGYGPSRGRGGYSKNSYSHQKWDNKNGTKHEKDNATNVCYRCGGTSHWSRVCRTPKHLIDLYQQSLKQKGKKVETNLVFEDGEGDFDHDNATHLEVADFFTTPEGNN